MKNEYLTQMRNEQREFKKNVLALAINGVVAKAQRAAEEIAKAESLAIDDVCKFADELNSMLSVVDDAQQELESYEKYIAAEATRETEDDGNE